MDHPLAISCLGVIETAEINSIIKHKLSRLKRVCRRIETCKVRVANIARQVRSESSPAYLISISLYLPDGVELYTLRLPLTQQDSLETAIADVFAKAYRQLIELQIEEKYLLAV